MVALDVGFGTVDVWVNCDGERLEEHSLKPVQGSKNTQECYIASKAGKAFEVEFSYDAPTRDLNVTLYVDGVWICGKCPKRGNSGKGVISGRIISATTTIPVAFAQVALKEDDGEGDLNQAASLGTIRVMVSTGTQRANPLAAGAVYQPISLPGEKPLNEKSKKAGAHISRFLDPISTTNSNFVTFEQDNSVQPREIVFRYAPLDFLYAREIIPNPNQQAQDTSAPSSPSPDTATPPTQGSIIPKQEDAETKPNPDREGKKRNVDEVIDLSSDEDMTPEEREVIQRVKARKLKKMKKEPIELKYAVSGDVIDLSD